MWPQLETKTEEKKSIRKDKYADKSKLILILFNNHNNILWNLNLEKIKNVKTAAQKLGEIN